MSNDCDEALEGGRRAAIEWLRRAPEIRYAEVRFVDEAVERLRVRDGRAEQIATTRSCGVGVRVLGARTWGFACTADASEQGVIRAARTAMRIAQASGALTSHPVPFPAAPPSVGTYVTRLSIDPFTIRLEDKLAYLDRPVRALRDREARVRSAEAWMDWTRLQKHLLTTEGTDVRQELTYGSCGMHVFASDDSGAVQRRSYPTWHGGDGFQGGYERIAALNLDGHVDRVRDEAIALLSAPPCPESPRDLLLESSQVGLQIHESCGHPTELDRALGSEISLAGGSFMQPSMLGKLRYGSEMVTLVADATSLGGNGTFGWDDEGVPAAKHALIERGIFVDYLSSRETAAALGRTSTGTMRADSWNRPPLIRMPNVSLEPGSGTLADIIADTRDGVLMATDKSWSIDDLRLNFQFSCEIAWEIKAGKVTRILRDPFYTGITPAFWRSCDAIAGPSEWKLWGITSCGKGDPTQTMHVGHGASPARFRNVSIGNSGAKR